MVRWGGPQPTMKPLLIAKCLKEWPPTLEQLRCSLRQRRVGVVNDRGSKTGTCLRWVEPSNAPLLSVHASGPFSFPFLSLRPRTSCGIHGGGGKSNPCLMSGGATHLERLALGMHRGAEIHPTFRSEAGGRIASLKRLASRMHGGGGKGIHPRFTISAPGPASVLTDALICPVLLDIGPEAQDGCIVQRSVVLILECSIRNG
mmetsp:Transcript_57449/g.129823  ORF Transcript_57449/g.129823 Transcript_57449/m.129823 type:complete len:202 (+) Transcript_57449:464-1069(+)